MGGSTPNIPGVKLQGDQLFRFRTEVSRLLGRSATTFPGAQPVSFAAKHKLELQKHDYFVCEKSDGIRCLMYLTSAPVADQHQEVTYLVDRKNDYYYVEGLHFPKSAENPQAFHENTILDGELVNDKLSDGKIQLMYLVFDCLVLDGERIMELTLDKRIGRFRDIVFKPYKTLFDAYPDEKKYQPFLVDWKMMERSYGIEKMFKDTLPKLPHGNDGLIFTCRTTPYQFGTDQHILKWKPAHENSIDFRMTLDFSMVEPDSEDEDEDRSPFPDYEAVPEIRLSVFSGSGREDIPYGTMSLDEDQWEKWKALEQPLNDRVVECSFIDNNRWKFLRFRDDKNEANHISTVQSVIESIQDKVTEEDLIRVSKPIRDEWKKREKAAEDMRMAAMKTIATTKAATNGQERNANPGLKRKFEGNEEPANGRESG
ncbi:Dcp1p-Dcp2p decapping enzyme complex alpha subunit [Puttea exsequens]|nr:Dcp1p-Dcp2p decapping enzyme complex alpha subunit [Puttea exsequens]